MQIERRMVQGMSLAPFISDGQKIKLLLGYYQCHPINRNDVIVYQYAGQETPLLKIVKGLPGDRFAIARAKNGSEWNLLINDQLARNSEYIPYSLTDQGHRLMELYARDYGGTIPRNAYLILGNRPEGTLDSTRFGLVGASEIIGKAIPGETPNF